MPQVGNEIFGRPVLADIQARVGSETGNYLMREILRASRIMQALTWEPSNTLTPTHKRSFVTRVGQLRAINTDYAPKFSAAFEEITTRMSIFGDAFEWDRVIGAVDANMVAAQLAAMAPGINNRFSDMLINGANSSNALEFDGLSKVAEDNGREITGLDLTVQDTGNNLAFRRNIGKLTSAVDELRSLGLSPAIIANKDAQTAFSIAGGIFGDAQFTADAFNAGSIRVIQGAPVLDSGLALSYGTPTTDAQGRQNYPVETAEVIPSDATTGMVTDIYVVGIGIEGVTGVTLDGFDARTPVRFETARTDAGAIRRAEIEFVAGIAVKNVNALYKFSDAVVG